MIPRRERQGRKGGEGKERRRGKGEEIEEAAAAADKSSMGAGLAVVAVDGGQQAVSCRWHEGSEHKVCQEHRVNLIKEKTELGLRLCGKPCTVHVLPKIGG